MLRLRIAVTIVAAACSGAALAQPSAPNGTDMLEREVAEEDLDRWSGDIELGMVVTTGNTETESINGKARVQYETVRWRHTARAEGLKTSDEDGTTAERYVASAKTAYKLTERDYIFGNLRYEKDRFGGFDYRWSETVGYGRRVIATDRHRLDLEAGVGARHEKPEDGGDRNDDAIVQLFGDYEWKISDHSRFSETVLVESGESNTYAESETGLRTNIVGSLAMKLAFTVKHNTDVPPDTERTDTITSVNLVYGF